MKERPILFSAPMVRAIIEGRKTVTRRVVKAGADLLACEPIPAWEAFWNCHPCPYGQPGDRLWVRETWGVVSHAFDECGARCPWRPDRAATQIHELPFGQGFYSGHVIYAADGGFEWCSDDDGGGEPRSAWKPSIHMPRAASRITLEVTGVRAERLQDISEADAAAEGIERVHGRWWLAANDGPSFGSAGAGFRYLWESINGYDSWNANPWVWVVEFRLVQP